MKKRLSKINLYEFLKLWRYSKLDLGVFYVKPLKIVMVSIFWAPLIPIVLVFSLAGLVTYYLAIKWVILNKTSQ